MPSLSGIGGGPDSTPVFCCAHPSNAVDVMNSVPSVHLVGSRLEATRILPAPQYRKCGPDSRSSSAPDLLLPQEDDQTEPLSNTNHHKPITIHRRWLLWRRSCHCVRAYLPGKTTLRLIHPVALVGSREVARHSTALEASGSAWFWCKIGGKIMHMSA